MINNKTLAERFMRYVRIDTQSDPTATTNPSTEKQKNLSQLLCNELKAMGIAAETDVYGYVYGSIPSNTSKAVPAICFCSHVDTAPDCSGTNVQPILHANYQGQDIMLPLDNTQVLSTTKSKYLSKKIGDDIITASGDTLLGSDDKAGVAIIMQAVEYLINNPSVKHGDIKILFTPDEEVGRGTEKVDLQKLGAKFGYTLDGGEAGSLEDETFSADSAIITINGIIAHPGYAKGKLVNALKIAAHILEALPKDEFSPETTTGRIGFVHPVAVNGIAEKATIQFIVRDFEDNNLLKHHARLKQIADTVIAQYPNCSIEYSSKEQYRNMKEILDQHPQITAHAEKAYQRVGLTVLKEPIRGGTDGSRLSFMGLPCPNIFTGMQAIHSRHEWIGVRDMEKAVEVLVELVQVWAEE